MEPSPSPLFIAPTTAALMTGLTPRAIELMAQAGDIASTEEGGRLLVSRADLDDFVR